MVVQASSPDVSAIKLERTVCFGTCPIYSVTIFRDGRVVYEGTGFVKARGIRRKSISPGEFNRLVAKLDDIGFFGLRNSYRSNITDLSSIIISLTRGSQIKSVEDYYGAPKRLRDFEEVFDRAVNISRWVNLSDKEAAAEWDRAYRVR